MSSAEPKITTVFRFKTAMASAAINLREASLALDTMATEWPAGRDPLNVIATLCRDTAIGLERIVESTKNLLQKLAEASRDG